MSSRSSSRSSKRGRSGSPATTPTKLFITNLEGKTDLRDLETELTSHFEKYGEVSSLVVKRNRNSEYCFAFVEMKSHQAAVDCVKGYTSISQALAGNRSKQSSRTTANVARIPHSAATTAERRDTLRGSAELPRATTGTMDEGNAAEVDRTADVIGSTRRDIEASAATEDAATSGNVTKRGRETTETETETTRGTGTGTRRRRRNTGEEVIRIEQP